MNNLNDPDVPTPSGPLNQGNLRRCIYSQTADIKPLQAGYEKINWYSFFVGICVSNLFWAAIAGLVR